MFRIRWRSTDAAWTAAQPTFGRFVQLPDDTWHIHFAQPVADGAQGESQFVSRSTLPRATQASP
jgi:hypothetical protein